MRKIYYELVDLLLLELKILNKIKKNIKTILRAREISKHKNYYEKCSSKKAILKYFIFNLRYISSLTLGNN